MATIRTSKEIGARLKQLREQARVSQEKMAELVGVSRGQIQKYERGQDMLNAEKLQLAANSLSVTVQEFFVDGGDALPLAVEEKLLLEYYRAIPDNTIRESILKITTNAAKQGN